MFEDDKLEFYQGIVSNSNNQTHAITSGDIKTSHGLFSNTTSVSGGIETNLLRVTEFKIGDVMFRCAGDVPICDGDEVRLLARGVGLKEVVKLANKTRDYHIFHDIYGAPALYRTAWSLTGALGAIMFILGLVNWDTEMFLAGVFFGGSSAYGSIKHSLKKHRKNKAENEQLFAFES